MSVPTSSTSIAPKKKLAVELDGAAHDHETISRRDDSRTAYLQRLGISVLRIENRAVFEDPEAVLAWIAQHFCDR